VATKARQRANRAGGRGTSSADEGKRPAIGQDLGTALPSMVDEPAAAGSRGLLRVAWSRRA
jgi:hypothetical protein